MDSGPLRSPAESSLLLKLNGVLAVQMPDNWLEPTHVAMREVALEQDYPDRGREPLPGVHAYYDILSEAGCDVDIWRTTYYHKMSSHQAIIDWVSATGLRPWLQELNESEQKRFLKRYHELLEEQYPLQKTGRYCWLFQGCLSWLNASPDPIMSGLL